MLKLFHNFFSAEQASKKQTKLNTQKHELYLKMPYRKKIKFSLESVFTKVGPKGHGPASPSLHFLLVLTILAH